MSDNAITGPSPIINNTANAAAAASVGNNLTQKDFLSLMTTQLENQDPLKPMDDSQFVAELAQFTSLQQTTDISSTLKTLTSSVQQSGSMGYLGKQVTLTDSNGNSISGLVTNVGVDASNSQPAVTVNGQQYDISTITGVSTTAATSGLSSSIRQINAVNYLGKQVTLTDSSGNPVTGTVTAVGTDAANNQPAVTVNGAQYDISKVTSISNPVAAATSSSPSGS